MNQDIPKSSIEILGTPLILCGFGLMIFVLCLISFKVNRKLPWGRWISIPFYIGGLVVASGYFFKLIGFGPGAEVATVYNAAGFNRLQLVSHWLAFFIPVLLIAFQVGIDGKLRKNARRIAAEDL
jgi:hypothetical protein